MAERRWSMRKIEAGDWLLLGNDDRTWFRIARGDETDGEENERLISVWQVWRWRESFRPEAHALAFAEDVLDWSHWSLEASWLSTRAEAVREVVRLSTPAS